MCIRTYMCVCVSFDGARALARSLRCVAPLIWSFEYGPLPFCPDSLSLRMCVHMQGMGEKPRAAIFVDRMEKGIMYVTGKFIVFFFFSFCYKYFALFS